MGGRILALKEEFGYREIMVVTSVEYIPQLNDRRPSTVLLGDQLMFQYDNRTGYVTFMRSLFNQKLPWSQLSLATANETEQQAMDIFPRLPWVPICEEELTLIRAGHDPLKGYYVQFDGTIRMFSQPRWWEDEETF